MVTVQALYLRKTVAFWSSAAWPSVEISALSSSKYTGFSGDVRFSSSSEAVETGSLVTGSGGTMAASFSGSAGVDGRAAPTPRPFAPPAFAPAAPDGGAGGVGRATG